MTLAVNRKPTCTSLVYMNIPVAYEGLDLMYYLWVYLLRNTNSNEGMVRSCSPCSNSTFTFKESSNVLPSHL